MSRVTSPPPSELNRTVGLLQDQASNMAALPAGLDFDTLRSSCIQDGRLYEDPDFPAIERTIFYSRPVSRHIRWRRPPDFCDNPEFIVDGASRFDLHQDILGNCWFVAAAATLATKPSLLAKVVPEHQSFSAEKYAGIFHFYFWRYGEWQEVVIDDRLPVKYGKFLLFCKNKVQPNEFWSALMEKAYAKLHGSYEALEGGKMQDALVDFTGGVGEVINLQDPRQIPRHFFTMLTGMDKMNSLMGCCIQARGGNIGQKLSNGLFAGHAYSITGFLKVSVNGKTNRLIRMRNPYGAAEWTGPWSDGSGEWQSIPHRRKEEIGLIQEDDGEFWMSFDDWKSTFTEMQLCHLTTQSGLLLDKKRWCLVTTHGSWVRGVTAGGCGNPPHQDMYWMNPQYHVTVDHPDDDDGECHNDCTIIISLMQKHRRRMRTYLETSATNKAIGFDIFKVVDDQMMDGDKYSYKGLRLERRLDTYSLYREVCLRHQTAPGTYCIIPATYSPNEDALFFLRVVTPKDALFREVDDETGPIRDEVTVRNGVEEAAAPRELSSDDSETEKVAEALKMYSNEEGAFDAKVLQHILNHLLHLEGTSAVCDVSIETARNIQQLFGKTSHDGRDPQHLQEIWNQVQIWLHTYHQCDKDGSEGMSANELKTAFQQLGFSVSRRSLAAIVDRYGSSRQQFTVDDFLAAAAKVHRVFDVFSNNIEPNSTKEIHLDLEKWMETTLRL